VGRVTSSATLRSHPTLSPFRKLDERRGDRLLVAALGRIEPARADQSRGNVWRNVEAHDHNTLPSPLAPSPCALSARGQLDGSHRDFPHRFRVCLAYAGRVAGLAGFPHARPHRWVQPGLRSYGLPEHAGELGKSSTHGHCPGTCTVRWDVFLPPAGIPAPRRLPHLPRCGRKIRPGSRPRSSSEMRPGLIALAHVARHTQPALLSRDNSRAPDGMRSMHAPLPPRSSARPCRSSGSFEPSPVVTNVRARLPESVALRTALSARRGAGRPDLLAWHIVRRSSPPSGFSKWVYEWVSDPTSPTNIMKFITAVRLSPRRLPLTA
jgi:hypothetical protein